MSKRLLFLAVLLLAAETAGTIAIVLASNTEPHKAATLALALTAGISFVASGLIALRRRPGNRTGLYLAAVGYCWFLGALTSGNGNGLYTAGAALGSLAFIPFAALVLAFPGGRLDRRADRMLVQLTTLLVVVGPPVVLLFDRRTPSRCKGPCPHSAIVVYGSHRIATILNVLVTIAVLSLITAVVIVIVRRWRLATAAARRVLRPVYLAGGAALIALLLTNLFSQVDDDANNVAGPVFLVIFATVPFAFLFGILRSRLARGSVAGLVVALGHGTPLRDALASTLGDPSLELAYWIEDRGRFVDREGRPTDLPTGGVRSSTMVERDDRLIGALLHDPSLLEEPELVGSVAAAAALALDNERLGAEVRAQHRFLTTIVDTAPSLLVVVDTEGRIRELNPATLTASGCEHADEVRERPFWDVFIDPSERDAMKARFEAAAPGHAPAEYENTFTNARGEQRSIIWRGMPVRDSSGAVESIVAAGLDVTERRRQEQEIRASRARIVAAGDDARRRLERNLHDGAQQRLVSLSIALRLARSKLETDPGATAAILAEAGDELAQALEELRELARGIHPAVLTDRGLAAALEGLAARSPVPVDLTLLEERLPAPVEAAAYYVVSEALANVVKHAGASSVEISIGAADGLVTIEVADDGAGGADPARGSGLRGLADRVAALDGRLHIESLSPGGTRVLAEIPLPARVGDGVISPSTS